jgi:hypothetical protein
MADKEKQEIIKDNLLNYYMGYIDDVDFNDETHKHSISADFSELSVESCYSVHDIFVKHGVSKKGQKHDHEHSCCYYYFNTRKAAENFVKRLANFMFKRMSIANDYGLEMNWKWFDERGIFNGIK